MNSAVAWHRCMGGATIGSEGYKYPPLSKVYPPHGGYRGYKLCCNETSDTVHKTSIIGIL